MIGQLLAGTSLSICKFVETEMNTGLSHWKLPLMLILRDETLSNPVYGDNHLSIFRTRSNQILNYSFTTTNNFN